MATAMWRMNGPQEKMSGVVLLLLGALLLNNGVMCQGNETGATTVMDASVEPLTTGASDSEAPGVSGAPTQPEATVDVTGAGTLPPLDVTIVTDIAPLLGVGGQEGPIMSTVQAGVVADATDAPAPAAPTAAPETDAPLQLLTAVVTCEEKIINHVHVKAVVNTNSCEETKAILESAPAAWCAADVCRLDVSQDGNKILVASPDATSSNIEAALLSEKFKDTLGVTAVETSSSSSGASVFVGVLLTGLLLAASLIGGYCFKNRRTTGDKGIRLAEEAYPVDGENQGNTLVSVAPLVPPETQEPAETTQIPEPKEPAEIQEKPSENGETPDEVKTDPPPPTNGHSTAAVKTADTEL